MLLNLVKAGYLIFFGVALGRISGFVREMIISYNYGGSFEADAVVLMLTVPDLLVNILLSGGLSAILIPEFKRLPAEKSWQFFVKTSFFVSIVFSILTLFFIIFTNKLLFILCPGFEKHKLQYIASLLQITLLIIPLTTLTGITTAFLQANNKFGVAALGTFLFNLSVIIGLYLIPGKNNIHIVAYFVLIGAAIRLLTQYIPVIDLRVSCCTNSDIYTKSGILRRYAESIISVSCVLLLPIIARSFISYKGDGIVALFNYGIKIYDFIYGSGITIISVIIFPKLSELAINRNENSQLYFKFLKESLYITIIVSVAATVTFLFYSDEIVSIIYYRGSMQIESIEKISFLVKFTLCILVFQGISSILITVFNAERNTRTLLLINATCVFGYTIFCILAKQYLGIIGIMTSLVIVNAIIMFFQIYALAKKHNVQVLTYIINLDMFRGVFIVCCVAGIGYHIISLFQLPSFIRVMLGGVIMIASILLVIISTKRYLYYLKPRLGKIFTNNKLHAYFK